MVVISAHWQAVAYVIGETAAEKIIYCRVGRTLDFWHVNDEDVQKCLFRFDVYRLPDSVYPVLG